MYHLQIEPAQQPVDFSHAMRELYDHAHHRHQIVRHEGIFDGQHRYSLLNGLDRHVEAIATIAEATR